MSTYNPPLTPEAPDEDDVICINNYPNMESWRRRPGRDPRPDARHAQTLWRKALEQLHAQYPDKPILITECGFPAIAGTRGHALGEDMQDQVIRAEFPALNAPYLVGFCVWCWADHRWPRNDFINMAISPFGVNTLDRAPKQAFATVRAMFRDIQAREYRR